MSVSVTRASFVTRLRDTKGLIAEKINSETFGSKYLKQLNQKKLNWPGLLWLRWTVV